MRKMRNLISQLYLLVLLALPFVTTACSDDDDLKAEITTLGIENGTTVNVGQVVQLEAQTNNLQGEIAYTWQVNGKDVSTESSYTFIADEKGAYTINLSATSNNETVEKSVSVNAQMYTSSFFVINEGQYGNPGSINKYKEGEWNNNITPDLGMTTTVGVISGDYMYAVSKNAPSLIKISLKEDYSTVKKNESIEGQGNNICIINQETGILTTTKGAYEVELSTLTIKDKLEKTGNSSDIFNTGKYIFILDNSTIKVYNTNDFSFKQDLTHEANTGFTQSKDGTLWAAKSNKLIKINIETLESEELEIQDNLKVAYNSMAYTPSCLCASPTKNVLYFADAPSFNGKNIYKYDIASKTTTKFFTAPTEYSTYGAGVQVDSRNGDVYLVYTEDGWGAHYLNTNIYVADGITGAQKAIIDYSGVYWFPSSITFQ